MLTISHINASLSTLHYFTSEFDDHKHTNQYYMLGTILTQMCDILTQHQFIFTCDLCTTYVSSCNQSIGDLENKLLVWCYLSPGVVVSPTQAFELQRRSGVVTGPLRLIAKGRQDSYPLSFFAHPSALHPALLPLCLTSPHSVATNYRCSCLLVLIKDFYILVDHRFIIIITKR